MSTEEVVIKIEPAESVEPEEVVEPVVVVAPELPAEILEELTFLREFKRADDERRIVEAEEDAAAALALSELALSEVKAEEIVEEIEEELPPVEVEQVIEDTPPDDEPANSHGWFKRWF